MILYSRLYTRNAIPSEQAFDNFTLEENEAVPNSKSSDLSGSRSEFLSDQSLYANDNFLDK